VFFEEFCVDAALEFVDIDFVVNLELFVDLFIVDSDLSVIFLG